MTLGVVIVVVASIFDFTDYTVTYHNHNTGIFICTVITIIDR